MLPLPLLHPGGWKFHIAGGKRFRSSIRNDITIRIERRNSKVSKLQSRDRIQFHQLIGNREMLSEDCVPLSPVEVEVRINHRRWSGNSHRRGVRGGRVHEWHV